jgi:hypothetical protein
MEFSSEISRRYVPAIAASPEPARSAPVSIALAAKIAVQLFSGYMTGPQCWSLRW